MKHLYRPLLALLMRASAVLVRALSRRTALALGRILGWGAYRLSGRQRRRAIGNLGLAFGGDLSRREIERIARRCFCSFGKSFVETLRIPGMPEQAVLALVDADSLEPVERGLARGKGVIVLCGHMGAWEIEGAYLAARFGRPVYGVARRLYFGAYNDLLVAIRRCAGVETVYQDQGARPALRALKSNRPLVVLADQDIPRLDGVFVEFFGRPAHTPTGPAALARASGAAIVPVFITWNGRRHRLHVLPELELVRTGDRAADTIENTRRWSRAVESVVRHHPEHWAWFHRRWRTTPPAADAAGPAESGVW